MNDKKYSVNDITRMRKAIGRLWVLERSYAHYTENTYGISSFPFKESERESAVEARLFTYMQAGTAPADLEQEAENAYEQLRDKAISGFRACASHP